MSLVHLEDAREELKVFDVYMESAREQWKCLKDS